MRYAFLLLAAFLVLGSGCGSRKLLPTEPTLAPLLEPTTLGRSASELDGSRGARTIIGRSRDGAHYALYRPARWNRMLVAYAHGYTPPGTPIALPVSDNFVGLRDALLAQGFAVAYSSYSENGFAVADGILQTRRVTRFFDERLGHPRRTFVIGSSMGGLIALALAERDPDRYDGALVMSGMLAGSQSEIDYIAHVRVLFDVFYPGVLPGDLLHLPANVDLDRNVIGPAVAAIQAHPEGAFAISQILRIPFNSPEELVTSIVRALGFQVIELRDLLQRTNGESFFDNRLTVYAGPLPAALLADVNARVARHGSSERVKRLFVRFYEPTGRLEVPVLALHTTRDPVVPISMARLYGDRVAARGGHRFELRIEDRFGHTGFTVDAMMSAFRDLVERDRKRHHDDDDKKDDLLIAVGE